MSPSRATSQATRSRSARSVPLTGVDYRFRAGRSTWSRTTGRVSTAPAAAPVAHPTTGGEVEARRLADERPRVNEQWNCDKGPVGSSTTDVGRPLITPLVRENGELVPASWPRGHRRGSRQPGPATEGVPVDAHRRGRLVPVCAHSRTRDRLRLFRTAHARYSAPARHRPRRRLRDAPIWRTLPGRAWSAFEAGGRRARSVFLRLRRRSARTAPPRGRAVPSQRISRKLEPFWFAAAPGTDRRAGARRRCGRPRRLDRAGGGAGGTGSRAHRPSICAAAPKGLRWAWIHVGRRIGRAFEAGACRLLPGGRPVSMRRRASTCTAWAFDHLRTMSAWTPPLARAPQVR